MGTLQKLDDTKIFHFTVLEIFSEICVIPIFQKDFQMLVAVKEGEI